MITEIEFCKRYESEKPLFTVWGKYVNDQIINSLIGELGGEEEVKLFLKVPSIPRTKNINSILSKAFYRNKRYCVVR